MGSLSYESWKVYMRLAIQAASIVRECHDKMSSGRGAPDADDMKRYIDEAAAIAELWDESTAP